MDATSVARQLALGRLVLGAGLTAAPGLVTRMWLGSDSSGPSAKVIGRGLGARDVAIGAGLWRALDEGANLRPWLLAGVAGDLADGLGTLAAGRSAPLLGRVGIPALALGAAGLGVWAARQVAP